MARITKPVEERRQEIIDTAREIFIENGFDKTQVADISKKMNVASGLVYHYFKSKTDILYAVVDELAEEKMLKTKNWLDKSNGSAFDRLKLFFSSTQNLDMYEKLFSSLATDKAIIEYCRQKISTSSLPLLCSLIENGNEDGSWNCEYPKETAVFILHGWVAISELPDAMRDTNKKFKILATIIFRILGVPSS